jgi:murein peptide amidase A
MAEELKSSEKFESPQNVLDAFSLLDTLGRSAGGNPIYGKRFTSGARRVLFLGGVHGNETEGVAATKGFFDEFVSGGKTPATASDLLFVPVLSPDGFLACSRHNGNAVDLNRNMATKDWKKNERGEKYYSGPEANSEPETKLLLKILEDFNPEFILSLHSWKPMFNINGPARTFAEKMHEHLKYEITEDIGYPTPGSLGTYAGWERQIPTITFEIERGLPLVEVYPLVRNALLAVL